MEVLLARLPPAAPDAALAARLLTQPLAVAAMAINALIIALLCFDNAATFALLQPFGGRRAVGGALNAIMLAVLPSYAVAMVWAHSAATAIGSGGFGSLIWALLALLGGFPVCRHLYALRTPKAKAKPA